MNTIGLLGALLSGLAAVAAAQSTISTSNKFAYAANTGWIDFRSSAADGVVVSESFLPGKVYAANLGWIALNTASSALVTTMLTCPDSDGDGIGDAYEMRHFGSLRVSDASSDFDGDGASDRLEYAANTDPKDPASLLRITRQAYNNLHDTVTLTFTSSGNRLYAIEHNTDLAITWTDCGLAWFAPDPGATSERAFTFTPGPRRFFRVLAHLPLQP